MAGDQPRTSSKPPEAVEELRMSIGAHLDELRIRLIYSIVALVVAGLVCIWPSQYLLAFLARPVILALERHNQPLTFLATGPTEAFLVYVKVVLIAALVLAGPFIIYQAWQFVAAGLYPKERVWVYKLIWPSLALFALGVAFMYTFVLVVSLNFLIGFTSFFPLPDFSPTALERTLLGERAPTELIADANAPPLPPVPFLLHDPNAPAPGTLWFNENERRLKLRGPDHTWSLRLEPDGIRRSMMTTHFRINEYLSFVLTMTIAFGVAFQLPLVVVFLARSGIVPLKTLRRAWRLVVVVIVLVAGMLAPPDLLSHMLLSVPMILLYLVGLFIAGRTAKPTDEIPAETPED